MIRRIQHINTIQRISNNGRRALTTSKTTPTSPSDVNAINARFDKIDALLTKHSLWISKTDTHVLELTGIVQRNSKKHDEQYTHIYTLRSYVWFLMGAIVGKTTIDIIASGIPHWP
jgi:hypothetical protein